MNQKFYPLQKYLMFLFLIVFCFAGSAQINNYYFNQNFNEAATGPALIELLSCNATQGSFVQESINTSTGSCANGALANTFKFGAGGGLEFPNANSFIGSSYTIHVFFKFSQDLNGYSRIIDFSNSTADAGIYLLGKCLNFYPSGNIGVTCPFEKDKYFLISFSRDGATNIITVYVDGVLFTTYNDANNLYRPVNATAPIRFFRDDNAVPCEVKAGNTKYISVSNQPSSSAAISNVWSNICGIALAVTRLSFSASVADKSARLLWQTATETNTSHFDVERSTNGFTFAVIGRVNAKGNSNAVASYQFVDKGVFNGENFYRLKQVDKDGRFSYSAIVKITFNGTGGLQVFPTPAKENITISGLQTGGNFKLLTAAGSTILQQKSTSPITTINILKLPVGTYWLQVWDGTAWQQKKVVKE
ncbi:hypothetical protein BH10BAC3_BH10BAC3_13300 [soil metagenome]